jgi:hypothetical protein
VFSDVNMPGKWTGSVPQWLRRERPPQIILTGWTDGDGGPRLCGHGPILAKPAPTSLQRQIRALLARWGQAFRPEASRPYPPRPSGMMDRQEDPMNRPINTIDKADEAQLLAVIDRWVG